MGAFLIYASANSPVPIAGELRTGVGLDGADAGLFMLPFAGGFAAGCVVWFALARHGAPATLLPLALALVAAGTLLIVSAADPAVVGVARFAVGLASAGFPPAAQAVIAQAAPPHRRGRLIGGFGAAVVTGGVLGQALVGALADLSSADTALIAVCAVAPLMVAVTLRAALPAAGPRSAPAPHGLGALLVRQWPPYAIVALMFGSYWLMLTQLAAEVRGDRFGLSAAEAGLLPVLGVAGVLTTLGGGAWTDRAGHRAPVIATVALGLVALAVTLHPDTPLWLFGAAFGTFIAAYWGVLAPSSAEVTLRSHDGARQPAMMAFYAAAWVGAALFTAVGTLWPGWTIAGVLTAGAWVASGVVAATRFRHGPAHAVPVPAVPPGTL